MKKKAVSSSMISILLILILIGVSTFYVVTSDLFGQRVFSGPGCQFIANLDDPQSVYSEVINGGSYTCDATECIVSAMINIQEPQVTDTTSCSVCLHNNGKNEAVKLVNNGQYQRTERCNDATDSSSSNSDGWKACKGSVSTVYQADWNFCPDNNRNFEYCDGNLEITNGPGKVFTDRKEPANYKLSNGQRITLDPRYPDNSEVQEKSIFVQRFDCSCLPAIKRGQACDPGDNKVLCSPGTKLFYSANIDDGGIQCESECLGSCEYIGRSNDHNFDHTWECSASGFGLYQICDGSVQVEESQCSDWGTTLNCPSGQECFVDSTGSVGEGIGSCQCPATSECGLGDVRKTGSNTYEECTNIGGCPRWGSSQTCAGSLVSQSNSQTPCICDSSKSCDLTFSECIGSDNYRECETYVTGGKQCTKISDPIGCTEVQRCSGGSCTQRTDIGCAFPNSPNYDLLYKCDTRKDLNNIAIETCTNNVCRSTNDIYSANEQDKIDDNTKCYQNNVYQVSTPYNTRDNLIYRWELSETCDAGKPFCSGGNLI